jgi:drug/metabolite transporter (DMT)-like permease
MLTPRDLALLLTLAAIWGSSYLWIRMLVPVLGVAGLVGVRMLLSGALLLLLTRALGLRWGEWRFFWPYVLVALLSSVLGQAMLSYAALTLNSPTLAILNATAAMFAALISYLWLKQKLPRTRVAGLLVGVAGVALVVGFSPLAWSMQVAVAYLLALGAPGFYAASSVYAAHVLKDRPAHELAVTQSSFAGVMMVPIALPDWLAVEALSGKHWAALLMLAWVCTGLANWMYYKLMIRTNPTVSLSTTYLIPCFALIWGWLFADETIVLTQLAGFAVVCVAIGLIARRQ